MEKEPKIYDVIAAKLQLDVMYGQTLASLFTLAQLLPALVEAGALSKEQVEAIITNASLSLDAAMKTEAERDPTQSDTSTVEQYAKSALQDFRNALSDDNEESN
jgi:hypothetical protein